MKAAALAVAACLGGHLEVQPGSTLDLGWTGVAHEQQLAAGPTIDFLILRRCTDSQASCATNSDCANDECVPTCDCTSDMTCEIQGPVQQRRCARVLTACETSDDCPPNTPCVAPFGPPLPISAGGAPICVTSHFDGPLTGTLDVATGASSISSALVWRAHLGITLDRPCPQCGAPAESPEIGDSFTCSGGQKPGQTCRVDAVTPLYGGTSYDCAPSLADSTTGAGLSIRLDELTTGTTTRTAQLPCAGFGFPNPLEEASRCTDSTSVSDPTCSSNADCRRCSGSLDPCTTNAECTGEELCAEAPDQPITCGYWCHCGFCNGDPNSPCFDSSQCDGGVCVPGAGNTAQPNAPQQRPNGCTQDRFICGTEQSNHCAQTELGHCSDQPYRNCSEVNTCQAGDQGVCVFEPLPCFESRINRTGEASPVSPEFAALTCVPGNTSTAVNNTIGLTGPATFAWKTSLELCPCLEPDPACEDVCNYVPSCGNEIVDSGEACDGGACCTDECTFLPAETTCRAGVNQCDPAEQCTGSSSTCPSDFRSPNGTECVDTNVCTTGDVCVFGICRGVDLNCGDNELDQICNEQCDDGNTADGDGCSATCRFQQVCGDANDDGEITASDAQRILQRAVDLDVDCPDTVCDVDGTGAVTTADALRTLRRSVGLPVQMSCEY